MVKENLDTIEPIEKEMAIPEAIIYKRKVLLTFFDAIEYLCTYNTLVAGRKNSDLVPRKIFDTHTKLQGCILGLYMQLYAKLKKDELKKLSKLENNTNELLSIEELKEYLFFFAKIIDKIGITKIELPQEDKYHVFRRP